MYKINEYLALAALTFFIQTKSIAIDNYTPIKHKQSWFGYSIESNLELTLSNIPNTQKVQETQLQRKTFPELKPAKPILSLESGLGLPDFLSNIKPKFVYLINTE